MRILVTNDDGYRSPGVRLLREALGNDGHTVWMLAPAQNMSACSQAITTQRPLRVRQLREKQCFSCDGTPTDCVILALRGLLDTDFDCVVSGINLGRNLGDDIIFSGTVAAARMSTLMGVPAIAASLVEEDAQRLQFLPALAAQFSARLADLVALCDRNHLVSVNIPNSDQQLDWHLTAPTRRFYRYHTSSFTPPNAPDRFIFMSATPHAGVAEAGSDLRTVQDGHIAVSVIDAHPTVRTAFAQGSLESARAASTGEDLGAGGR